MKKVILPVVIFFILQGCAGYNANIQVSKVKTFPPSQEMKIAVLPFIAPSAQEIRKTVIVGEQTEFTSDNAGGAVADSISSALMGVPNIVLIERSRMERILDEHKLSLSGVIKNPDFNLLGKILPVDAIVIGSITTFSRYQDRATWGGTVAYSARMVDIHSGEVLFMINCSNRKIYLLPEKVSDDLARDAIKKLLEK